MLKKLIILFIFILILVHDFIFSAAKESPALTRRPDSIISMKIADYRAFLKTHPPLDRLYCQGETCFFLVENRELAEIQKAGAVIQSQEQVPDSYLGTAQADREQGDINGPYHTYNETNALLRQLESRYPNLARVTTIGYSIEGRELNVIKISDNAGSEEAEPNIWVMGCHHAREWISVEVPLLFAQYLLEHYQDNADVRRAVDGAQLYIIPLLNPDGLEFSIHTYRMWRKNRRNNGDLTWGVDINRNYGYMWGYDNEGSSPNSYYEDYRGPSPFSEPETDAIRQFLLAHPPAGTISYHNFSQLIIYPWGYTHTPAPDAAEMNAIAAEMSDLIYQVSGRVYQYGSAEVLYLTNGDLLDWVYGTFGTPAFTVELPPEYLVLGGFFTSIEMIESAFNENLPSMLYFVNYFISKDSENPAPAVKTSELSPKRLD